MNEPSYDFQCGDCSADSLSVDTARSFAKRQGAHLRLNGLTTLNTEVAEALATWNGTHETIFTDEPVLEHLELNGLTILSVEAAKALAKWGSAHQGEHDQMRSKLSLKGLSELSPDAAIALAESAALELELVLPHWDRQSSSTVLLMAVRNECEGMVKELVANHDVDVNISTTTGDTTLHLAAAYFVSNPEACDHNVDQWFRRFKSDQQKKILKLLLAHGGDPNRRNASGDTPLHVLAANKNNDLGIEWLQLLLEHRADPNIRNADGNTPLHLAVMNWHYWYEDHLANGKNVEVLLRHGADPNAANATGDTPLHLILFSSRDIPFEGGVWCVVEHLMRHGADPKRRNAKGESPLSIAMTSTTGNTDWRSFLIGSLSVDEAD